jgi:TRAP-type transport system small permease protein
MQTIKSGEAIMQSSHRGEIFVVRFSRLISLIGFAGLLVFAVATVIDVLMRWIFNSPITGVRDASSAFTSVIIASCFALCIVDRSNITIRFLGNALGRTWREVFESFGNLLTLLVFGFTSWQLWLYAGQMALDGETTWVLGWPLAPWWYVASVLIGICVPVQGFVFWQTITSAFKGKE